MSKLIKEVKREYIKPLRKQAQGALKTIPIIGKTLAKGAKAAYKGKLPPQRAMAYIMGRPKTKKNNNRGNSSAIVFNSSLDSVSRNGTQDSFKQKYGNNIRSLSGGEKSNLTQRVLSKIQREDGSMRGSSLYEFSSLLTTMVVPQDVNAVGANVWSFDLNPTTLFPSNSTPLTVQANSWQFYEFIDVQVQFKSLLGYNSGGMFALAYNGLPNEEVGPETLQGYQQAVSRYGSEEYSVNKSTGWWKVPLISNQNAYVCQPSTNQPSTDILYDQGKIYCKLFSSNITNAGISLTAGQNIGVVDIKGKILFYEPEIELKNQSKTVFTAGGNYTTGSVGLGKYPLQLTGTPTFDTYYPNPIMITFPATVVLTPTLSINAGYSYFAKYGGGNVCTNVYDSWSNLTAGIYITSNTAIGVAVPFTGATWVVLPSLESSMLLAKAIMPPSVSYEDQVSEHEYSESFLREALSKLTMERTAALPSSSNEKRSSFNNTRRE
jgi:hypothetical protein